MPNVTNKILPMVKVWQNRPAKGLHQIIFKVVTHDLKPVYKTTIEDMALQELIKFDEKWGKKYPIITKSRMDNWAELAIFFKYPANLCPIIYTINVNEAFHL